MKQILYMLFLFPVFTQAQIITTIAGNGTNSYTGDGGPATAAEIWYPWGLATDISGNAYFTGSYYLTSDYNNVRKINAAGIISSFAGNGTPGFSGDGGPATAAQLNYPMGVATDGSGNLYILDWNNYRIRKVNTAGIISTIAGTGINGNTGDGGPATAAEIYAPYAITCDASGNIYFGQFYGYRIRKIYPSGTITTFAGSGSSGFSGDGGPATMAQIGMVYGLATDPSGNVYIADYTNNRVRVVNSSGIITTIAGSSAVGFSGDGGPATDAALNGPLCLAIDLDGNINISDYGNDRIRRVSSLGTITTFGGNGALGYSGDGGPATAAKLNHPCGIAVDPAANVLFSDWNNYRVRMITYSYPSLHFTGGHIQSLNLCVTESATPVPINSLLAAVDAVSGLTDTWSVTTSPAHGILVAAYTATSTGGIITPTGLTYTPASGYIGADMFKVGITNGTTSDSTTINVTINPAPNPGVISGTDSICPGQSDTLYETATGGYWNTSNFTISSVSGSGVATGLVPGMDTIIYTDSNMCGTASAFFTLLVRSYTECHTGIHTLSNAGEYSMIYPNPANSELTICSANKINQITITNLLGQTLFTQNYNSEKAEIDVADLPAGVYFIKINGSEVRKFIKE